jgi:transcriptional regulator with XRE-family HTH domain
MDYLNKNRLRELRTSGGLAQWQVEAFSGVHQSRLSLLERGVPPRKSEIKKLTRMFKLDAVEIWPDLETEAAGVRK